MTKFEEEVKRPDNGPITELNNSMQSVLSQYRKMREYADYLEYELKQKDEHILKLENENSFMRDERTTFDSNGMAVEPKLQQQSLPVVPECVAKWIDKNISVAHNAELMIHNILICAIDNKNRYLFPLEVEKFVLKNPITFLNAVITGKYQVEKPQLFYLREKNTGYYLRKKGNNEYGITPHYSNDYDEKYMHYKFTQKEIDKLDTGSYELVPVEDGE
ncbi:DUF1642 domain-containing protein [Lactococcus lactis]|uniref:DUF1642 domain-containing protein n=1 Tax=Lactococcus lactis TaxID=1358 RepID=UPI000CE36127|nr:DUF1642 domain-containing protein [Lactococcus lactis]PPA67482.1 hypothetical protein C3952_01985 [Lactococcus lactis]